MRGALGCTGVGGIHAPVGWDEAVTRLVAPRLRPGPDPQIKPRAAIEVGSPAPTTR